MNPPSATSFIPHSSVGERPLALCVALIAGLSLVPSLIFGLPGGKAILGGLRILDGEVPYRDFWSIYAPGMFYLQALLFALFGKTILPQAFLYILVHGTISALIFSLAYRLSAARVPALMLAGIYMVQLWHLAIEISHFTPALVLILFALERTYRYVCGGDARRLLIQAGIALGFAAWFKHDVAAYAAIGVALGLTLSWYALPNRLDNWLSPFTASLWIASASLAIALPMVAWLAFQAGPDAWIDLIVYPATEFRDVRAEGLPALGPLVKSMSAWLSAPTQLEETRALVLTIGLWVLFYMPVAAFAFGTLAMNRFRHELSPAHASFAFVLLATMPFYWNAMLVQHNTHAISLAVVSFLLSALCWRYIGPARSGWRALLILGILIYATGLIAPTSERVLMALNQWSKSHVVETSVTGRKRVTKHDYEVYQHITDFVVANTEPGEAIYSGVERHDVPVIGNLRFYYLADRPVATKYHEVHPAIHDSIDIQREMIQEFESANLRCVILWRFGWSDDVLDAIKAKRMAAIDGLGSTLLDEWLQAEFEPVFNIHQYVVLWHKDATPPRDVPASIISPTRAQ